MNIMLIHSPLDDPTIPYHSTAYLKGHLASRGFQNVTLRDLNVEYVSHLLHPDVGHGLFEEARRKISATCEGPLAYQAQEEVYRLLAALRGDPVEIDRAAAGLRDPELFLDFNAYRRNVETISSYMNLVGALSYPSEYEDFCPVTRGRFSMGSMKDLLNADLGGRTCMPFVRYFNDFVKHDPAFAATDLFGISIVYDHQLCHAFQLARMLRRTWPSKQIVFGGTAISQLYKYMQDKSRMKDLFTLCDAIVVGEGETAICEIAASDGDLEGKNFTNTITYSGTTDRLNLPTVHYEDVVELGSPEYDHPWSLYLSPERGINYSPTRGCYWNRCTFCDYGLNTDKPTSPWRERKIDQVVEDLTKAVRDFGVRYVYFAVDVMAPGYLDRLSDAILDSRLNILWSAELRMERIFSEERTRKMQKAGCVSVSFGMESGNQRILDLIDKGTKVDYMGLTMKNFATAGIACQLMAFTDFPSETEDERKTTRQFIHDTEPYWSAGGLGTFLLTRTSIIARHPAKFGLDLIQIEGVDSPRAVAYRLKNETDRKLTLTEDSDSSFDNNAGIFPSILGRPWAGGIDSLHSMIYYNTFGREFFKYHPAKELPAVQDIPDDLALQSVIVVNGELVRSSLDLAAILQNRKRFLRYVSEQLTRPAEPTYSSFCHWAETLDGVTAAHEDGYWIVSMTRCAKIDKTVFSVLEEAVHRQASVSNVLADVQETLRGKLLRYITALEGAGLISFRYGNRLLQSTTAAVEYERRRAAAGKVTPEMRLAREREPMHTE